MQIYSVPSQEEFEDFVRDVPFYSEPSDQEEPCFFTRNFESVKVPDDELVKNCPFKLQAI